MIIESALGSTNTGRVLGMEHWFRHLEQIISLVTDSTLIIIINIELAPNVQQWPILLHFIFIIAFALVSLGFNLNNRPISNMTSLWFYFTSSINYTKYTNCVCRSWACASTWSRFPVKSAAMTSWWNWSRRRQRGRHATSATSQSRRSPRRASSSSRPWYQILVNCVYNLLEQVL